MRGTGLGTGRHIMSRFQRDNRQPRQTRPSAGLAGAASPPRGSPRPRSCAFCVRAEGRGRVPGPCRPFPRHPAAHPRAGKGHPGPAPPAPHILTSPPPGPPGEKPSFLLGPPTAWPEDSRTGAVGVVPGGRPRATGCGASLCPPTQGHLGPQGRAGVEGRNSDQHRGQDAGTEQSAGPTGGNRVRTPAFVRRVLVLAQMPTAGERGGAGDLTSSHHIWDSPEGRRHGQPQHTDFVNS